MIEELKRQIETLANRVEELESMSGQVTFLNPTSENIIRDIIGDNVISTGLGTAGTDSRNITSTPATIIIPPQPSGTLKVRVNGVIYELYYK